MKEIFGSLDPQVEFLGRIMDLLGKSESPSGESFKGSLFRSFDRVGCVHIARAGGIDDINNLALSNRGLL